MPLIFSSLRKLPIFQREIICPIGNIQIDSRVFPNCSLPDILSEPSNITKINSVQWLNLVCIVFGQHELLVSLVSVSVCAFAFKYSWIVLTSFKLWFRKLWRLKKWIILIVKLISSIYGIIKSDFWRWQVGLNKIYSHKIMTIMQ